MNNAKDFLTIIISQTYQLYLLKAIKISLIQCEKRRRGGTYKLSFSKMRTKPLWKFRYDKKGLNPKPNTFLYDPIKIGNPGPSVERTKREKRKQFVPE